MRRIGTQGGDISMTDGPYAETKEQMGGFWVVEISAVKLGAAPPP